MKIKKILLMIALAIVPTFVGYYTMKSLENHDSEKDVVDVPHIVQAPKTISKNHDKTKIELCIDSCFNAGYGVFRFCRDCARQCVCEFPSDMARHDWDVLVGPPRTKKDLSRKSKVKRSKKRNKNKNRRRK